MRYSVFAVRKGAENTTRGTVTHQPESTPSHHGLAGRRGSRCRLGLSKPRQRTSRDKQSPLCDRRGSRHPVRDRMYRPLHRARSRGLNPVGIDWRVWGELEKLPRRSAGRLRPDDRRLLLLLEQVESNRPAHLRGPLRRAAERVDHGECPISATLPTRPTGPEPPPSVATMSPESG